MLSYRKKTRIPDGEISWALRDWVGAWEIVERVFVINWEGVYIQYRQNCTALQSLFYILQHQKGLNRQELPRFQKGQFPGN